MLPVSMVFIFFKLHLVLLYCECVRGAHVKDRRQCGGVGSLFFYHVGSGDEIQHQAWLHVS